MATVPRAKIVGDPRGVMKALVDAETDEVLGVTMLAHDALLASFDDLVSQLALGPEPELRECPKCGGVGMRRATVCSGCWTKLTPPD